MEVLLVHYSERLLFHRSTILKGRVRVRVMFRVSRTRVRFSVRVSRFRVIKFMVSRVVLRASRVKDGGPSK